MTPERLVALKALAEAVGPNEDRTRWFRGGELASYLRRADASVTPDADGALMTALDPLDDLFGAERAARIVAAARRFREERDDV